MISVGETMQDDTSVSSNCGNDNVCVPDDDSSSDIMIPPLADTTIAENSTRDFDKSTCELFDQTTDSCSLWSDALKSPPTIDNFSPSLDYNKIESCHGFGLDLATERSKMLSQCGRHFVNKLLELASLYGAFAQSFLKACSSVDLAVVEICPLESIQSFSEQFRWLSTHLREDVALPLQAYYSNSHGDVAQVVTQKFYTPCRAKCIHMRQKAVSCRSKYLKALQEAESAWTEWHEEQINIDNEGMGNQKAPESTSEGQTSQGSSSVANDDLEKEKHGQHKVRRLGGRNVFIRVCRKHLKEMKQMQKAYEILVQQENGAVKQAQNMEAMALEALQKLEEQRVLVFVNSVQKILKVVKASFDNMVLFVTKKGGETKAVAEKKSNDFFKNLLNKSSHEDGMGRMEADTLGIPVEVGELRDKIKARFASRTSRVQVTQTLLTFLEDMSNAANKFATGLKKVQQNEATVNGIKGMAADTSSKAFAQWEGPRAFQIWSDFMSVIEREAEAASQLARSLQGISSMKLDEFVINAEKGMKVEADAEDAKWKHLCDAARTESRAEARYRQTTMQTTKARERARTADEVEASNPSSTTSFTNESPRKINKANEQMSKALGNMFSILPDGGEKAMQLLRPDARRAVARRTLKEADEKESKDRQVLDSAAIATSRALEFYRTEASGLVAKYEQEDKAGWEDVKDAIESIVSNIGTFRAVMYDCLEKPLSNIKDPKSYLEDQVEWTQTASKAVAAKAIDSPYQNEDGKTADRKVSGFMLKVQLEKPENISKMISMVDNDAAGDKEDKIEQTDGKNREDQGYPKVSESTLKEPVSPISNSFRMNSFSENQSAANPNWLTLTPQRISTSIYTDASRIYLNRSDSQSGDEISSEIEQKVQLVTNNENRNPETENFITYFLRDSGENISEVEKSFACAILPKSGKNLGAILHGRIFLTRHTLYFFGWTGRKAFFKMADIIQLKKNKNKNLFDGAVDTVLLTYSKGGEEISFIFGCYLFRDQFIKKSETLMAEAKMRATTKALQEFKANEEIKKKEDSNMTVVKAKVKAEKVNPTVPDMTPVFNEEKGNDTQINGKICDKGKSSVLLPDVMLEKMEIILSNKTIRCFEIQRYYEVVWSEGNNTNEKPFYQPWLQNGNCVDIDIGEWQSGEFKGEWCGEKYPLKRMVAFKIKRKGMYVGPPVVDVQQVHYCRIQDNDRCVVMMNVQFKKIPYCDTFCVHARWVASRKGLQDISLDVGVFVEFKKSTILKNKIRSSTISETRPTYQNLYEWANRACKAARVKGGEEAEERSDDEKDQDTQVEQSPPNSSTTEINQILENVFFRSSTSFIIGGFLVLFIFYRFFLSNGCSSIDNKMVGDETRQSFIVDERIEELNNEMRLIRQSLQEIVTILKDQAVERETTAIEGKITDQLYDES